jgi:transcriptional regulator with XRE-family HTH domain
MTETILFSSVPNATTIALDATSVKYSVPMSTRVRGDWASGQNRFPEFLRKWMDQRFMSVVQVADEVGVNHGQVSNWLSGIRRPSPASLAKLSDVLGYPVSYLMEIAGWTVPDDAVPRVEQVRKELMAKMEILSLDGDDEGFLRAILDQMLTNDRRRREERTRLARRRQDGA